MQFEPMIKARLNSFCRLNAFESEKEDRLFELFVNDTILRNHQPDYASSDSVLLEAYSVGGSDDMGIDGIAIKVNGVFVSSEHEIKELIELTKQISVEFIFVQSKNKNKIDSGEYGKFADGVRDFLCDDHKEPHNEKIEALLRVKDFLFSDEVILRWKNSPSVRIYYVIFGNWREDKHISAKAAQLETDIQSLQSYGEIYFRYIDSADLKKLCKENEDSVSSVISVIDSFGLNEVENVSNSLIVLFSASELIKMITTEDKVLRQNLFTDNVRDYQGSTNINEEILTTIKETPSNFSLLNNGITIVCNSVIISNRKLTLSNPQIVNGCQTCNVLFDAYTQQVDISKVTVLAKIIATEKDDLTTTVIRGTNSQNVVCNEAFETTRDFHKNLEDFFNAYQNNEPIVYYERRSRQYARNADILPNQIANLRTLTQSFVSVFMQAPHMGNSHEAILLKKYKNSIFVDGQSFLPYFTATLMCLTFEKLKRENKIDRSFDNFKYHIMFIASEQIAGVCPSINDSKIDDYCKRLLAVISDSDKYATVLKESNKKLQDTITLWVKKHGKKYRHAIKDNQKFTVFLSTFIRGGDVNKISDDSSEELVFRGKVVKARKDRNGLNYGFIQREPDDVFFHQKDNTELNFDEIYGRTVLYRVFQDSYNGDDRAEILEVL